MGVEGGLRRGKDLQTQQKRREAYVLAHWDDSDAAIGECLKVKEAAVAGIRSRLNSEMGEISPKFKWLKATW